MTIYTDSFDIDLFAKVRKEEGVEFGVEDEKKRFAQRLEKIAQNLKSLGLSDEQVKFALSAADENEE